MEEAPHPIMADKVNDDDYIRSRIFTIRGVQVMLDRDLAGLYDVPTKRLNEQVKRNQDRFPESFMFRLTASEVDRLALDLRSEESCSRSQFATLNKGRGSNIKYRPLAFTEHGIIMLASVLKSASAVDASIRITNAFVAMRKMLASVAPIMARIAETERIQLEEKNARLNDQARNEERFDVIFKAMEGGEFPPQKVFYDGMHYDAYSFATKLVRKALKSIVLVDGYCDDVTLDILATKRGGVSVTIATAAKTAITSTAIEKFNKQHRLLTVKTTAAFHDRFMILDNRELYHLGAPLKDLGRKYCAVVKMDAVFIAAILERIGE